MPCSEPDPRSPGGGAGLAREDTLARGRKTGKQAAPHGRRVPGHESEMPYTRAFCTMGHTSRLRLAMPGYTPVARPGAIWCLSGPHSCRTQFLVEFRVSTYHAAV